MNNITTRITEKIGKNLHNKKNHPIEIIKEKIYEYFGETFNKFDNLNPLVSVEDNFDKLLIEKNHSARSTSDTYYLNKDTCLRTHTSAHQNELLSKGFEKFLVTGDVYRKDEIDSCHYPVFHQMEGVCILENKNAKKELIKILSGLVSYLFPNCEYRVNDDYFPFTNDSIELEVKFENEWLEILGGGVIKDEILTNCGINENKSAWAFGLGLERLAMILFKIKDIRYFWTTDERFHKQFKGKVIEFKEYSKYPPCHKDVAFWLNESYNYNNFCEIVREVGGDIIEEIKKIDEFTHPKTNKVSNCYRITYRSNDRSLTNEEVDSIQNEIRTLLITQMSLELR